MKQTMKSIFSKTLVVLVAVLCFFVFTYHRYQAWQIQKAMNEHAKIVAGSIWDLNPKGSEEYLRAVAALNHYEYIIVKDDDGNKFIEVRPLKINPFENQLIRLKLIQRELVSANVYYNKELLGKVEALWLDKSIYVYAYAFVVGLLLFVVVQLYKRILRTNATLEKKVEERTQDLTEKTEQLQESEQKIRAIFNQSLQFIGLLDADGILLEANQPPLQAWGLEKSDVINKPFWETLWFSDPPELKHKIQQYVEIAAQGKIVRQEIEHVVLDGSSLYVDFSLKPIFDENGKVILMIPEGRDITDLKLAEAAYRSSMEQVQLLLNSVAESIIGLDNDGNCTFCNPSCLQLLGYEKEQALLGRKMHSIIHYARHDGSDYPESECKIYQGLKGKEIIHADDEVFWKEDGSSFWVEYWSHPIVRAGEVVGAVITFVDISERKEAQAEKEKLLIQLQQAQKMEAIGTLAGGIAHDFNNILSAIFGYAELSLMELPDDSNIRTYIKEMYKAANRARELVKQILTFSRQETQHQSPVEAHIVIKEALKLLRASIPATIEIKQNIAPYCGSVLASPTQIHQIIMNLCTNAYHAMRVSGGVLGVSLMQRNNATGKVINGVALQAGPYLQLEVSDTGHGIDRDTIDRIFEPYFTTKAKGDGTGLGLSAVHGIVKNQGGQITVNSEPGEGTTFKIYWPVIEQSVYQIESVFPDSFPEGNENILLIDDEESTLRAEEAILKKLGYHVHAFMHPLDAMTRFRDQPDMYDLVVTDTTMPMMTGDDVSRKILAIRPDMPIILCTGYSDIITEARAKEIGIKAFVMKPVEIKKFAELLRKLLDGTGEK
jgi:PAS domain S-box-containing protein